MVMCFLYFLLRGRTGGFTILWRGLQDFVVCQYTRRGGAVRDRNRRLRREGARWASSKAPWRPVHPVSERWEGVFLSKKKQKKAGFLSSVLVGIVYLGSTAWDIA